MTQQVKVIDWRNNGERVILDCSDHTRSFNLDDSLDRERLRRLINKHDGEPFIAALDRVVGKMINVP